VINRGYGKLVDRGLARRYPMADFFFSLEECLETNRPSREFRLAETATVALMIHPTNAADYRYLMSDEDLDTVRRLRSQPDRGDA